MLLFKLKSSKIVQRIKDPPKKTSFVVTQAKRSAVKLSFHEDIRYTPYSQMADTREKTGA